MVGVIKQAHQSHVVSVDMMIDRVEGYVDTSSLTMPFDVISLAGCIVHHEILFRTIK